MIKHINYQTIVQNGVPAFVVIAYDEFLKIYPGAASQEPTTPHEVVGIMVKSNVSIIRAWREYLGLTQQEVADKMGITQAALSQIESNTRPRKETLQKLAAIFGVEVSQLR